MCHAIIRFGSARLGLGHVEDDGGARAVVVVAKAVVVARHEPEDLMEMTWRVDRTTEIELIRMKRIGHRFSLDDRSEEDVTALVVKNIMNIA